MTTADDKMKVAIKSVKEVFNDTSVSRATTRELLDELSSEINVMIAAIDEDAQAIEEDDE